MITIGIGGGTGNQMFQYALARSLAYDLKTDFNLNLYQYKLLPSFLFKTEKHQRYNLNHFNIKDNFSSPSKFILNTIKKNFSSTLNYVQEENIFRTFNEYNSNLKNLKGDIFLRGNWQNEKYFSHNHNIIRNDFKIVTPPTEKNQQLLDEILSNNSIALCVRRNDYFHPFWKAQLGFTTLDYYKKAVSVISEKVENPFFYIFSDDPIWTQKNIKLNYPTKYITHNGVDKDYEDLRLISACDNFIISNSTFHWWGAWLNPNKDKIVIAPNPWFNSYTMEDIIPDKWIKIKCNRSDLFNFSSKTVFEINEKKYILDENQKIDLKHFIHHKSYYKSDNIMKIIIDASDKGFLKITSDKIKPIYLAYYKGISERYVCIDKKISLDTLKIYNEGDKHISINYIGIKN